MTVCCLFVCLFVCLGDGGYVARTDDEVIEI